MEPADGENGKTKCCDDVQVPYWIGASLHAGTIQRARH